MSVLTKCYCVQVQIDLEHFPRGPNAYHMATLTRIVCNVQTALKAKGLRLHSMDVAPWGTYENFNMSALVQCMDYILPMGYCDPQSGTVAGPTIELDVLKNDFLHHIDNRSNPHRKIWEMSSDKIILGLPFFGYNFKCSNATPTPFPPHSVGGGPAPICKINDSFPMTDHFVCIDLYNTCKNDVAFQPRS